MFRVRTITDDNGRSLIQAPPVARYLFQSTGIMSVFWLLVRLYLAADFLGVALAAR